MSDLETIRNEVKNMQPHIEKKNVTQEVVKKVLPTDLETKQRAANARKNAHRLSADMKRDISMEIKNKLSESFDFIEESCGSGSPSFEFYEEPKMVSEGLEDGAPSYPIIGRASGVFAPIGVMSRNNRIYDNDHYDYLLENQQLVDRISHRGMLGTIGHHDKKVDDQDLAEGKVSHIVTNLRIVEEEDGSRNLYGTLEILDTPAGHLLKTYYDSGVPLFVSSRGGGNLLPVPNESYKRVDKTKYFLETFDIVKNPGFLQAKPVYERVTEGKEETMQEEDKVIVESQLTEDKLDKLTGVVTKLAEVILESKQADKAEDDEKKETAEKKEAKEAKEAKEKSETPIKEDKKEDKEDKDKPEDEKKDNEEAAVADSVTEAKDPKAEADKIVAKTMDPTVGLTKDQIARGEQQLKTLSKEDAENLRKATIANTERVNDIEARRREIANKTKEAVNKARRPEEKTEQMKLPLGESVMDAIKKHVGDEDKAQYLKDKAIRNRAKERDMADAKAREAWYKGDRQHPDTDVARKQEYTKNATGERETRMRSGHYGAPKSDNQVIAKAVARHDRKAVAEALLDREKPVVQAGEIAKNAQDAKNEVKEPVNYDHLALARAFKERRASK